MGLVSVKGGCAKQVNVEALACAGAVLEAGYNGCDTTLVRVVWSGVEDDICVA